MVDTPVSNAGAFGHGGSTPPIRTKNATDRKYRCLYIHGKNHFINVRNWPFISKLAGTDGIGMSASKLASFADFIFEQDIHFPTSSDYKCLKSRDIARYEYGRHYFQPLVHLDLGGNIIVTMRNIINKL